MHVICIMVGFINPEKAVFGHVSEPLFFVDNMKVYTRFHYKNAKKSAGYTGGRLLELSKVQTLLKFLREF